MLFIVSQRLNSGVKYFGLNKNKRTTTPPPTKKKGKRKGRKNVAAERSAGRGRLSPQRGSAARPPAPLIGSDRRPFIYSREAERGFPFRAAPGAVPHLPRCGALPRGSPSHTDAPFSPSGRGWRLLAFLRPRSPAPRRSLPSLGRAEAAVPPRPDPSRSRSRRGAGGAARRGAVRGLRPRGNSRGLGAAGAVGLTGRPGPLGAAVGSRWEGSPLNHGARSYLRGSSAARGPDGKAERPNAVGPRSAGRAAPRGRTATAAASGAGRAAEGARGRLGAAPRGGAARAGEKLAETAAASQALIAARGDVTPLGERRRVGRSVIKVLSKR